MVAADRPGVRPHRDRLQPHPLVGADVADHMAVVGMHRVLDGQVEVVAVLHQELAPAHHPEARPDLVAELPLDVVERQRQLLVGGHRRAEDVGDQLLVGRPVEHVALVAVLDPEHLGAVVVVAPALAPEVRRLQRRHEERDMPRPLLLLVHDPLDPAQHLVAERQPGIDPGARLPDHPRAQHQPVAGDLRLRRRLAQDRQEILAQAHRWRLSGSGPRRFRRSPAPGHAVFARRRARAALYSARSTSGGDRHVRRHRKPTCRILRPGEDPTPASRASPTPPASRPRRRRPAASACIS